VIEVRCLMVVAVAAAGCGRVAAPAAQPDSAVEIGHTMPVSGPRSPAAALAAVVLDARPGATLPPPFAEPPADEPDLRVEAPEANPRSKTVKLRLAISPPAAGAVMWGRKKLADIKPGRMTVEIERPRDSGPLDVLVRADGFLPHHVRLFTDRDDRLSVRLVRPEEARGMLGYRPPAATP
jgi:hypothetical protein